MICHAFLYTRQEIVENFLYTFCFCYYFYWTYQVLHCWRIIYCNVWGYGKRGVSLILLEYFCSFFFFWEEKRSPVPLRPGQNDEIWNVAWFCGVAFTMVTKTNWCFHYNVSLQSMANLKLAPSRCTKGKRCCFTTISNFHCLLHNAYQHLSVANSQST